MEYIGTGRKLHVTGPSENPKIQMSVQTPTGTQHLQSADVRKSACGCHANA